MSRIIVVVDSDTGKMIDVAGNAREGGRYSSFSKRMLSPGKNPVLDYGSGGGDTLTVWNDGGNGKEIKLLADKITLTGNLYVKNRSIEEIAASGSQDILGMIHGKEGEISVTRDTDDDSGEQFIEISLAESLTEAISRMNDVIGRIESGYVSKESLLRAIEDLSVSQSAPPEDVRGVLSMLLSRLKELARTEDHQDSSPEEPSPVEPSPVEPSPVEPSPEEPSPWEPSPDEPSPVEPSPEEPSPWEPSPEDE